MENVKRFKAGTTYKTRSIGDADCIFTYTILDRTAKRLTLRNINDKIVTKGIYIYDGVECCKPEGNYSMAPIITAEKEGK